MPLYLFRIKYYINQEHNKELFNIFMLIKENFTITRYVPINLFNKNALRIIIFIMLIDDFIVYDYDFIHLNFYVTIKVFYRFIIISISIAYIRN